MSTNHILSATIQFVLASFSNLLQLVVIILFSSTNHYSTLQVVYVTSFVMSWLATNAASLFWLCKGSNRDATNRSIGYVMHILQTGTLWRYVNVMRSHDVELCSELSNIRLIQTCTQYLPGAIMLAITLIWEKLPDMTVIIIIVSIFCMVLSSAVNLCIHYGQDETNLQSSLKIMPLKAVLIVIRVISTAMFISVYTYWVLSVVFCHVVISLIINCVSAKTAYSVPYKSMYKRSVYQTLTSDLAVNTLVSYMSFFDSDFTIWNGCCVHRGKLIIVLYVSNFVENSLMVTLYTHGSSIRDAASLVAGLCIVINVFCATYSSYRLLYNHSSESTADNESLLIGDAPYSVQCHISPYDARCMDVQQSVVNSCHCEDYTVYGHSDAFPLLDMYKSTETPKSLPHQQEHQPESTLQNLLKNPSFSPYTLTGIDYSELYGASTCSNASETSNNRNIKNTHGLSHGFKTLDYSSSSDSCSATFCEICDYQSISSSTSSSDWSSNDPYFSPPGVSTYSTPRMPLAPQISSKDHVMNWLSQLETQV